MEKHRDKETKDNKLNTNLEAQTVKIPKHACTEDKYRYSFHTTYRLFNTDKYQRQVRERRYSCTRAECRLLLCSRCCCICQFRARARYDAPAFTKRCLKESAQVHMQMSVHSVCSVCMSLFTYVFGYECMCGRVFKDCKFCRVNEGCVILKFIRTLSMCVRAH